VKSNVLKELIDVANNRKEADIVIKNAKVVDVYQAKIIEGDVAIYDKYIAGVGSYSGKQVIDANGGYLSPGFIDAHMHIESTYLSPSEAGRLLVPKGTTTVITDPHEIVNVCGMEGLNYMLEASTGSVLDIKYMLPSCVPCSPYETSGAVITADDMIEPLKDGQILGLGEFMNFVGINYGNEEVLKKIEQAKLAGKIIDGHAPGLTGSKLNGYIAAGIHTDHECSSIEEMLDRISRGVYVLLREGSACHDLKYLIPGVTKDNSRYCALCSDDREPKTILEEGHIDGILRTCVKEGLDPFDAIRMATINAAECYRLNDRGGIAPGLLANLVIIDNLEEFNAQKVFVNGQLVAEEGHYLKEVTTADIKSVSGSMNINDFSIDKLKLRCDVDDVYAIEVVEDGILTKKTKVKIKRDENNLFLFEKESDLNKIAVVERHHGTGNVGVGLIKGFNVKDGAIAQTIAHDSHNVVVVGASDEDMALAVKRLAEISGGIVVVKNGQVISELKLPIAGLMSDKTGQEVREKFSALHKACHDELGVKEPEPIVKLSFMSLPVIPEIKITDKGLFDVEKFEFI